jgi:hypothetical protein
MHVSEEKREGFRILENLLPIALSTADMGSGRAQQILDLHEDIKRTDSVLSTMSDMLSGFQEEMGVLSSQIQTLLDDSVSMKARLTNREVCCIKLLAFFAS